MNKQPSPASDPTEAHQYAESPYPRTAREKLERSGLVASFAALCVAGAVLLDRVVLDTNVVPLPHNLVTTIETGECRAEAYLSRQLGGIGLCMPADELFQRINEGSQNEF